MTDANVQISMTNLTQMDRYQTDTHRGPMVNQEQNADAARHEAARRIAAPVEPDKVEGKKIDPEAKREEDARKKRKRNMLNQNNKPGLQAGLQAGVPARSQNAQGRVIDFEA
jgi:hypothetical protein